MHRNVKFPARRENPIPAWFASRGWRVFDFQRETWEAISRGESGLVHSPTGSGKTHAIWGGIVQAALANPPAWEGPLRVLWITPLRALAADTEAALRELLEGSGAPFTLARRTGDSTAAARKRVSDKPPWALVTTPESLCILLSQPASAARLAGIRAVVVDEWHELLGTKRGVLLELALARLRADSPGVLTWGLSATLGNIDEASRVLGGYAADGSPRPMRILRGKIEKPLRIETLLPPDGQRFPWGGHLGIHLVPAVLDVIERNRSTLVFTNTRSQAELWFQAIQTARPELAAGLHHGSIAGETRAEVEAGLAAGKLRVVVATSSLDLGVDFSPVDAVVQVGSPKGVSRLIQRAGRSGHSPGRTSVIHCVPANTFELVEIAAARDLAAAGRMESRVPLRESLDVLCQHLATVAAGSGFREDAMLEEVRTTHAFRELGATSWKWAVDFASGGTRVLAAYPDFRRLTIHEGTWRVTDERVARRHRMAIGTITADASIEVRFTTGRRLGTVEESFISRLRPGDTFLFAGRCLRLVRVRDMTAHVKAVKGKSSGTPRWMGGRMPLSTNLAAQVRERLEQAAAGVFEGPEMERLRGILQAQQQLSRIPRRDELLIEELTSREGHHVFLYPFAGRLAHEGLAALLALRLGRRRANSFVMAVNDYGIELLAAHPPDLDAALTDGLLDTGRLADDIAEGINSTELARRQFREIARVAGLTFEGFPGLKKSARQLQVSASLLFEMFRSYDSENLLLRQAHREVLENQLEESRLVGALRAIAGQRIMRVTLPEPSPLAYPLFVERLREQVSTEALAEKIRRMELRIEAAAR